MGEISQAQFYEAAQKLHDQIDLRHKSLRDSMEHGFDTLTQKLDAHIKDDNVVEKRVTIMETERRGEAAQMAKVGTVAGVLAAAGLSAVVEGLKAYWRHS